MFGFNRRESFLGSLVSSGANAFRSVIGNNIPGAQDIVRIGAAAAPALETSARSIASDMILPEDSPRMGDQLTTDDLPAGQTFGQISDLPSALESFGTAARGGGGDRPLEIPSESGRVPAAAAREIMHRRLNNFQIERLAEQIRERLESEMKVERERHGEEP